MGRWRSPSRRDGVQCAAHDAELVADLAAEVQERDDGDDCDKCKDQRVLGKALAVFVSPETIEKWAETSEQSHVGSPPFPRIGVPRPRTARSALNIWSVVRVSIGRWCGPRRACTAKDEAAGPLGTGGFGVALDAAGV